MYKEVSESLSVESADPIILDVENFDECDATELLTFDDDDGTLLYEGVFEGKNKQKNLHQLNLDLYF